jgi:adenylate cyclase
MKRGAQLKLKQLKVIVLAWLIMGILFTSYNHLILVSVNSLGPSLNYSFYISLAINITAGLIGSIVGGSILVFYVNVKYQDKPYGYTIFFVCICFIAIWAFIVLLIDVLLVLYKTGLSFSDAGFPAVLKNYLNDSAHLKAAMEWLFVLAITQLLLQVNSKFGQSDFWNIIRGKYNSPKEETRIFMFLDLNSSTTIAEKLGDEKYHSLLKDFFSDITDPILDNKGSIYQYVGDEVVVAWSYEDGKENLHCINCFFDMKLHIRKLKDKYMRRYGLVPSFKAGIHCGKVIAGEVGIIKRDITYSGNVLNTTSRILNKCAELKEELIVSAELLFEINPVKEFLARPLGGIKLKGKEKEVMLNALVPAV